MLSSALDPVPVAGRTEELTMRLRRRVEIERVSAGAASSKNDPLLVRCAEALTPAFESGLNFFKLYWRGLRNAMNPCLRRVPLRLPGLPPAFTGLRVLQLSDLHIDGIDGLDEIVGDMVARLPVDICVLTGDYRYRLHGDCTEVYRRIQRILNRVDSVHGTFGILGNHDTAAMALELEQIGVRMLVNESIEIRREDDSIWIAGVDDPYEFRCADLELALETAPPDAFRILLAHTPQLAGEAAFHGIDLYLCGHTHAGQIQIPGLGPVISSGYGRRRFVHGLWEHGGTQGYTSAGVGCSMLPVRFNCPPEIVLFELHNFDSAVRRN